MTVDQYEDFLDSAAHAVADVFLNKTGSKLDTDEFCDLVDALDDYFDTKIESTN